MTISTTAELIDKALAAASRVSDDTNDGLRAVALLAELGEQLGFGVTPVPVSVLALLAAPNGRAIATGALARFRASADDLLHYGLSPAIAAELSDDASFARAGHLIARVDELLPLVDPAARRFDRDYVGAHRLHGPIDRFTAGDGLTFRSHKGIETTYWHDPESTGWRNEFLLRRHELAGIAAVVAEDIRHQGRARIAVDYSR